MHSHNTVSPTVSPINRRGASRTEKMRDEGFTFSAPAHGTHGLQPEQDGRVRCSAWLGGVIILTSIPVLCLTKHGCRV